MIRKEVTVNAIVMEELKKIIDSSEVRLLIAENEHSRGGTIIPELSWQSLNNKAHHELLNRH